MYGAPVVFQELYVLHELSHLILQTDPQVGIIPILQKQKLRLSATLPKNKLRLSVVK
jgi:hypothetical protein